MKIRNLVLTLAGVWAYAGTADAALIVDISGGACPNGSTGTSIDDVKAQNGASTYDATGCYGAFYGNDDPAAEYSDGVNTFSFLTKYDFDEDKTTGVDIGLSAPGSSSGSFTFDGTYFFDGAWMVVLKASNCWAGWTFGGGAYTGGTFDIGFRSAASAETCVADTGNPPGLSHISIYGTLGDYTQVPEPGTLVLLLIAAAIGASRRRR